MIISNPPISRHGFSRWSCKAYTSICCVPLLASQGIFNLLPQMGKQTIRRTKITNRDEKWMSSSCCCCCGRDALICYTISYKQQYASTVSICVVYFFASLLICSQLQQWTSAACPFCIMCTCLGVQRPVQVQLPRGYAVSWNRFLVCCYWSVKNE